MANPLQPSDAQLAELRLAAQSSQFSIDYARVTRERLLFSLPEHHPATRRAIQLAADADALRAEIAAALGPYTDRKTSSAALGRSPVW